MYWCAKNNLLIIKSVEFARLYVRCSCTKRKPATLSVCTGQLSVTLSLQHLQHSNDLPRRRHVVPQVERLHEHLVHRLDVSLERERRVDARYLEAPNQYTRHTTRTPARPERRGNGHVPFWLSGRVTPPDKRVEQPTRPRGVDLASQTQMRLCEDVHGDVVCGEAVLVGEFAVRRDDRPEAPYVRRA